MKYLLKKLLFVMVFCLVQSALCHADTFKGKIVNAETGEILIGANIFRQRERTAQALLSQDNNNKHKNNHFHEKRIYERQPASFLQPSASS